MKRNKEKIIVCLLFIGIFVSLFNNIFIKSANATDLIGSESTENELSEIIDRYGEENISFEDGIVINKGQTVQVEDALPWIESFESIESNNNDILSVDGLTINGNNEGVTFIIVKQADTYHVLQVYVYDETDMSYNIRSAETRRTKYVVYIDAGHGGKDPGSVANGIKEKDLNLTIALKVRNKLNNNGIEVVMNRDTDVFVDFMDTAKHANSVNPDVFVSIHNNSSTSSSANGIESFYSKDIDINFGTGIHNRLISNTGAYNRGFKKDTYYVTNHTTMPAILVEGGFLTNAAEVAKLKQDYYQEAIANAIVDGVMEYLHNNIQLDGISSERIYGSTRYETSYKMFEKGWTSSDTAILVSGLDYPDALGAAPLAGKHDAPILLVRNTALSNQKELRNMLINKSVKNVIIIGGTGVIPGSFESELSNMGIINKRIGGQDRFETCALIANEVGNSTGEIIVTSGRGFADGISVSAVAAAKGIPILITEANVLPDSIKAYLNNNYINKTYVVGGEGVITPQLVNSFNNPERLGGIDRYATNESIFNRFKSELDLSEIYLAAGTAFPDALASSAAAAKKKTFVVLSDTTSIRASVSNIINGNRDSINKVNVLSSNKIISDNILSGLNIRLSY